MTKFIRRYLALFLFIASTPFMLVGVGLARAARWIKPTCYCPACTARREVAAALRDLKTKKERGQ